MNTYEIWMEGYLATGMEGIPQRAQRMAVARGETFQDACDWYFRCKGDNYYDSRTLTYWGCKLFDNEADARRSFG